MLDIGPIPGNYIQTTNSSIYKTLVVPKLKGYLLARGLQLKLNNTFVKCYDVVGCKQILNLATTFQKQIELVYPSVKTQFLEERPDFYLGQILSMFRSKLI